MTPLVCRAALVAALLLPAGRARSQDGVRPPEAPLEQAPELPAAPDSPQDDDQAASPQATSRAPPLAAQPNTAEPSMEDPDGSVLSSLTSAPAKDLAFVNGVKAAGGLVGGGLVGSAAAVLVALSSLVTPVVLAAIFVLGPLLYYGVYIVAAFASAFSAFLGPLASFVYPLLFLAPLLIPALALGVVPFQAGGKVSGFLIGRALLGWVTWSPWSGSNPSRIRRAMVGFLADLNVFIPSLALVVFATGALAGAPAASAASLVLASRPFPANLTDMQTRIFQSGLVMVALLLIPGVPLAAALLPVVGATALTPTAALSALGSRGVEEALTPDLRSTATGNADASDPVAGDGLQQEAP